ncbi:MAG: hypothetical protein A2527_09065 [Candidatus Lambdaproteobacteria bacterium RIFOXYD2_FULL_50_16]|uniref:Uncharacterized protein n=1 Tax=Candidatus Lambdaproteobacteria bacterium RIFOXYD2_FULL_50_16 TaxID=1817772 RepID=A0A1F6G7B2_9PROT|nr:MAG: hypothetical protein A2527_09065 [Candidatus Lambdaproteobacteria bacterium RIFOXYD2_FULL_50_16]
MKNYFLFKLLPYRDTRRLVVYCAAGFPAKASFENLFREYLEKHGSFDQIYVIGSQKDKIGLQEVKEVIEDREEYGPFSPEVHVLSYSNKDGVLIFEPAQQLSLLEDIQKRGFWHILSVNKGLLQATPTHHFVLPSGKHSNQYIRVASSMTSFVEIEFMALFCLANTKNINDIKYIYCDTGGILPVAAAIKHLVGYLSETQASITFESFCGYHAVDMDSAFHFGNGKNSLFLISASAKGELANRLKEKLPEICDSSLIYLYSFKVFPNGKVLCNIEDLSDEKITLHKEEECDLCHQGSIKLKIVGDQLNPEASDVTRAISIVGADAPNWLNDFMMFLRERKIVSVSHNRVALHSPVETDSLHDIYIDLSKIFERLKENNLDTILSKEEEAFKLRLTQLLNIAVPRNLKRVIHLNNPGSKALAGFIKNTLKLPSNIKIIPFNLKEKNKSFSKEFAGPNDLGATLVVASVISSGRDLLGVSQVLRNLQRNHGITYLIGIDRLPSQSESNELRTNLTYGQKAKDYGYFVVNNIELPHSREAFQTSWQKEAKFLTSEIIPFCVLNSCKTLPDFQNRLKLLIDSPNKGLVDNLYWDSAPGVPLQLRKHTAFLKEKDYDVEDFSQADIYLLVSSVLHQLRSEKQKGKQKFQKDQKLEDRWLSTHEHSKAILSPFNFDRFNDGVLQASILRAALPAELDYSERKYSTQIREFLLYLTRQASSSANGHPGEALREFILCIAMGKMKLDKYDLKCLVKALENSQDSVIKALIDFITKKEKFDDTQEIPPLPPRIPRPRDLLGVS